MQGLEQRDGARISRAYTLPSIRTAVQYFLSHFCSQILNRELDADPRVNAISLQPWPLPPGRCADVAEPVLPNHFAIDVTANSEATNSLAGCLMWHYVLNMQYEQVYMNIQITFNLYA